MTRRPTEWRSFLRHIEPAPSSTRPMNGKPLTKTRDGQGAGDPDPVLSFVETDNDEPRPRLLVDRLLFSRALINASPILAPRFRLGDCAAAHHIVLRTARHGLVAAERLLGYGFRVERWTEPSGLRFFVSSSHSEASIRALLVAITIAVRELDYAAAATSGSLEATARRATAR
jgi:hypothetical protein